MWIASPSHFLVLFAPHRSEANAPGPPLMTASEKRKRQRSGFYGVNSRRTDGIDAGPAYTTMESRRLVARRLMSGDYKGVATVNVLRLKNSAL